MTFSSKVVVVTGGGQGIGAAAVLDFLAKNARVAVLDLDCQPLEQRLGDSPAMAARCLTVSGDCTDASVISSFSTRSKRHGEGSTFCSITSGKVRVNDPGHLQSH